MICPGILESPACPSRNASEVGMSEHGLACKAQHGVDEV